MARIAVSIGILASSGGEQIVTVEKLESYEAVYDLLDWFGFNSSRLDIESNSN